MLRQTGRLCQTAARKTQREIWTSLKTDHAAWTAQVGAAIKAELVGGDVQEAFRCLKGWYQNTLDSMARPCPQMMEQQTAERVALYARRDSPGDPLPINIDPVHINDGTPTDAEIWDAAQRLTNGWAPGASGMRAEDVKCWLHGVRLEEDPEAGTGNKKAGDNWHMFLMLLQAVWDHGDIPPQLQWVIVVLIPKGGDNYEGIGLLEPMWKVLRASDGHEAQQNPSPQKLTRLMRWTRYWHSCDGGQAHPTTFSP
jgi:hypothetical protein